MTTLKQPMCYIPRLTRMVALLAVAMGVLAGPGVGSATADYGDAFGIVPGSYFAGTCQLPAVSGSEATGAEAVEKRDCHESSTLAPETAVPVTQAGAHPDGTAAFELNPVPAPLAPYPDGHVRDVIVDLPPGLIGNPTAVPACRGDLWATGRCPVETQVGTLELRLSSYAPLPAFNPQTCTSQPNPTIYPQFSFPSGGRCRIPINSLNPSVGEVASFGFNFFSGINVAIQPVVRTDGDYGVQMRIRNIPQQPALSQSIATLWGVPSDPVHDSFRFRVGPTTGADPQGMNPGVPWPASVPKKAFLTNPTSCDGNPPRTTLRVRSWQHPETWLSEVYDPPPVTGCDQLPFDPSVAIAPTTSMPDAPTGLSVALGFPQDGLEDPDGLATAHLKKAVVALPEGMTINPAGANGLAACSDSELNLKSKDPVTCPDAAKIGTVTATSPVLKERLSGGVYIRSQNSDDPESGEMFRLALVLENKERALSIRLPGQVRADKRTGRLVTTFDNNPQLPVSSIELDFKDGPHAPLATPSTCGPKSIDTVLTSWGGQTVERSSTFDVACIGGLGGFAPSFEAGAVNPVAGVFSPFVLSIDKPDRDSALDGVSLKLPTGLLAKVKGNLGTQVGSVKAFAGPGSQPFMLPGTVTLEGAYGDAPYSLRVVVPAKAGPFDLGDVVVRQKVYVDPVTAEVTVVSDPVPTIVKGVPARMQRLDVNVDKPGFMINPTSCEAKEVTGTLDSEAGQTAAVRSRFQVGECAALPFKPRLAMRLTGRKQVTTGKHPGVKAQVNQTGVGEAGIKRAKVTLPKSLALDPENAQALCEFEDGTKPDLEKHCPAGSIVGRARATTPLLERDLVGNVYFVKNVRKDPKTGNLIRTLPMIVVALRGEIAINLKGESSTTQAGRLVNTFNNVPDAPITKFNLNIAGGQNGILAVTRTRAAKINVCAGRQTAQADMDGQNGRRHDFDVQIKTPCTKRQTKAAKRQAKRAAAKARH